MYHFFLHTSETDIPCTLPVRKTKPNPMHADSWRSLVHIALWRVLTLLRGGQYWRYELLKDGKPVSFAEACTEHWQLPFITIRMGGGRGKINYHIGPCSTLPTERGHGYYPMLLTHIIQDLGEQNNYYMIVDEDNTSSLRGIAKAGFTCIGRGRKNKLGQYIITNKEPHNG